MNQSAATGYSKTEADRLHLILGRETPPSMTLSLAFVSGHSAVRESVRQFLDEGGGFGLVIAGGGGGTLRAAVEGVCGDTKDGLPDLNQVRLATLRMGSGNVLAKHLAVPRDPVDGCKAIAKSLQRDKVVPCCVMRFETCSFERVPVVHYGVSMGGFGQFGRTPSDLARWRGRLAGVHRFGSRLLGVERCNGLEYWCALLSRLCRCFLRPSMIEQVEIRLGSHTESLRLLAAALLNFKLQEVPVDPGVHIDEPALSFHMAPYRGRLGILALALTAGRGSRAVKRITIRQGEELEIILKDRETAEAFLDEDPLVFGNRLVIGVAGTLAFVPGARPEEV